MYYFEIYSTYTYSNSKLNSVEYSKCHVTSLCTYDIYNIILSAMLFHLHHHQYPGEVMLELLSWEEALDILWLIFLRYRYMYIPVVQARKKHEFQLSFWKSSSQILLALSVSVCSFSDLDGRWLAWSLFYWASGNEKRLAQKQNLLVPDNWTAFFSSPVVYNKFITHRYTCL